MRKFPELIIVWTCLSLAGVSLHGQQLLTRQEALTKAFTHNLGVNLARNAQQIANNNASIFNTGELPTVTLSSGLDLIETNGRTAYNDGQDIRTRGATSVGVDAALTIGYLIYDGFARRYNIEKLSTSKAIADLELRFTLENTALRVLSSYYSLAQLGETLSLQREALEVSRQRLERTRLQYEYGQGTRLSLLNAEVDYQRDSVALIELQNSFDNARRNLLTLMGLQPAADFTVDTSVQYTLAENLDGLLEQARLNNVELLLAEKDIEAGNLDMQITEASKRPRISAASTFSWAFKKNDNQVLIDWQNTGVISAGLNLQWNIFDGGIRRTRLANTRILLQNLQLTRQQLLLELERDVRNSWQNYQTALQVLRTERENYATAQLNFERSNDRFNLGQITSIEFRQAQLNLLAAAVNLSRAKYNAKLYELELLQLSGKLLDSPL